MGSRVVMPRRKRLPFQDTSVSVDKSRNALRTMVEEWGGTAWKLYEDDSERFIVAIEFILRMEADSDGFRIRMVLPLPRPEEYSTTEVRRTQRSQEALRSALDHEKRRRWRCLFHSVRQKLVNIDTGIAEILDEFEPWVVIPGTDRTVRESTRGAIRKMLGLQSPPEIPQLPGGE